ncbi:response regulator [Caenimonas soli]|uniref:response regulator n=1 Tax=Caenimonas soli TaxID=2735555 RepID=UPI0015528944|nr:response regulator [Caenimonas soli]NPC58159.1 response regulator [Caenimonas soli]
MKPTGQQATAPAKILVVEDSATQAQRLRHSLEQQGYEVGIAGNGRLALEMLPRFRPDLIISDVNMPEMDGYELATCVKARADFSDIPVILVTTMSDPQDVIRGLECGADNFVLKPYDERYLLSRIRYVLVNREMRRPQDVGMGVEIYFNDRRHFITADRLQILNLLLSTYDAAIQRNRELAQIRESLEKHSIEIGMANGFLDSVVENIPDMIFVKDATDLRFVRVNRAGEELLGYSRDELHGKSDYDFFPKEEADHFTSKDREVLAGGLVGFFEEPIHTRHRGICILQTKKLAIFDEGGQPRYLLGIARDVTETRHLQDELQKRNAQLSELTLQLEQRVADRTRQLSEVVEALRESEERTRLTIDTALDAVLTMDAKGIVTDWNAQAEATYGWKREDAVGRPMTELCIPPQHREAHTAGFKRFLATGEGVVLNRRIEITAVNREGREFPIELAITPIKIKGEWSFSAFLRDITERKQVEERTINLNKELEQRVEQRTTEIVAAREAADAANRAKSTFLATMSHEIRTPMNGMLGMLELLGLSELSSEQHTILNTVRESSKSLLRIIDDILDFSMMEAGKLKVRPESTSIRQVIEGVRNIYSGTASAKGLLIQHSVDSRISPALLVDPGRVYQILNNFISNSIKFTSKGSIEIKAELLSRSDGHEHIRLSVKDTGIGISRQDQKRLFQPFSQVGDGALAGGTGLGLTICRRLAEMMGGSVEMVSAPGEGTTMTLALSLPIGESRETLENERAGAPTMPTLSGRRRMAPSVSEAQTEGTLILLVDDHPINRALLVRQVQALGYASESAEDGRQALEKWRSGQFGLVITDCHMPVMDGYDFAREVRRIELAEGRSRVPIIACTANVLSGEAAKCFDAGMDDYLVKPVELSQMLKKLQKWRPIPEAAGRSGAARVDSADVPVDKALIEASWGGGEATLRDVLAIFRRATLEDAAHLRHAVSSGDMAQVTHFAHRMLGASRMLGALGFAVACERIDHASRSNDRTRAQAGLEAFEHEWRRLTAYIDSLGVEGARATA